MSAPSYKPSMDDTIVGQNDTTYPPSGQIPNGKSAQPSPNNEDDLHRYVTDDAPRQNRVERQKDALIVSITGPAFDAIKDRSKVCADDRLFNR